MGLADHPVLLSFLQTTVKDVLKKISCIFLIAMLQIWPYLHKAWLQNLLGKMIIVSDSV